jgi:hypothetical protein
VPPLGAISQAWTSAEASLPLGWQLSGLYRFDELWIALGEGPAFDDYLSGSGQYAEQACGGWRTDCASGAGRRRG